MQLKSRQKRRPRRRAPADSSAPEAPASEQTALAVDQQRDRAFDASRRCAADRSRQIVAEALVLVQNYEAHLGLRKRRRRPDDQATFELAVEALLADAIHGHLADPGSSLMVSLSNASLAAASRYRPPAMTKALPDILERLAAPEMAYLVVTKGRRGFRDGEGQRTTFRAGDRLTNRIVSHGLALEDLRRDPHGEVIILKAPKEDHWDGGKRLEYADTDQTRRLRRELRSINDWLAKADIAFDEACSDSAVDDRRRELRRIFNSGRFDAGGRLFGGFWQDLKKDQRARGLSIDGQPVVTLDYRQMGPRMLYGLAGLEPPADCYAVPRYELYRAGWKKLFGALTHAGPELARFPQGTRNLFPTHLRVQGAIGALLDYHSPVADRFRPGAGLALMYTESQIMVDMLQSAQAKGIVALPIHDAVIVAHHHRDTMAQIMVQAFEHHVGLPGEVAIE